MTAILLASWLLSQTWAWDAVPGAVSYKVYWTERLDVWCKENVIIPATTCYPDGECQADWPEPAQTTYYNIIAVNAAGVESTWDRPVPLTVCVP